MSQAPTTEANFKKSRERFFVKSESWRTAYSRGFMTLEIARGPHCIDRLGVPRVCLR